MHRHLLENAELKQMFLAEARLAARVRHPNVVPILDVLSHERELLIVLEYVHGESLQALMRAARGEGEGAVMPKAIACTVAVAALHGPPRRSRGQGRARAPARARAPRRLASEHPGRRRRPHAVLDFGVAKAIQAHTETDPGVLKGKFSYMAPEVIQGHQATRRSDVFSTATVIWELLSGQKLFTGASEQERLLKIVKGGYSSLRDMGVDVSRELEAVVMKGLAHDPAERYGSALDMAIESRAPRGALVAARGGRVGREVRTGYSGAPRRSDSGDRDLQRGAVSIPPPSPLPTPAAGSPPPSPRAAGRPTARGFWRVARRRACELGRGSPPGLGITLLVGLAIALLSSRPSDVAGSSVSSAALAHAPAPVSSALFEPRRAGRALLPPSSPERRPPSGAPPRSSSPGASLPFESARRSACPEGAARAGEDEAQAEVQAEGVFAR